MAKLPEDFMPGVRRSLELAKGLDAPARWFFKAWIWSGVFLARLGFPYLSGNRQPTNHTTLRQ